MLRDLLSMVLHPHDTWIAWEMWRGVIKAKQALLDEGQDGNVSVAVDGTLVYYIPIGKKKPVPLTKEVIDQWRSDKLLASALGEEME